MGEILLFLIIFGFDKFIHFNTLQLILIWGWYCIACIVYQFRIKKIFGGKKNEH